MRAFLGIFVLLVICYFISENKKSINYKEIVIGILSQFILAFLFLKMPLIKDGFVKITSVIWGLKSATEAGTKFVFGYLGGGAPPFIVDNPNNLFVFMFQALPMIMVISALSMLLFHWGVLQKVVNVFAKVLGRILNIGGALCVAASAKIFVGQTEAPLLIRPYLSKLSKSELFTIITCGLATTSGTVLILYSTILKDTIENSLAHIFTVTIISIPAAIFVSRIIIPQTGVQTEGDLKIPYEFSNSMDAISRGTSDGLSLVLNISAMLIVMLAFVELTNQILGNMPDVYGKAITLERIFGAIFAPLVYLMGVPFEESMTAGSLLSLKVVMNEIVAFINMSQLPSGTLTARSALIMSYAICGFSNFSSIGIIIGTYSSLVPERKKEIVGMCFKALVAGVVATCISGAIAGILFLI